MQPVASDGHPGWERSDASVDSTLRIFYTTERAGMVRLSDGGGPFGFDITVALLVDDLVTAYGCDAIVETSCYIGDTTAYLTRRYPQLPVQTCDVEAAHATFTRRRLADALNVNVECVDSPVLVNRADADYRRPLYFLDAHWGARWPLQRELAAITRGVVVIHDFDIGHPRFSFDSYDGLDCGPDLLARLPGLPPVYFTPDPEADWPLPCLQTGRRAGVCLLAVGLDPAPLRRHPALTPHEIPHELNPEMVVST
jgi:hypothetical protein